jgi:uncharacterized Zn finger protein
MSRGRTYQRQGRVHDLAVTDEGRLLATVLGGDRYSVSVWWEPGKNRVNSLRSVCTCPVGANGCKHAVAVVSAYLELLAQEAPVPATAPDDPRWASLASDNSETAGDEIGADSEEEELAGRRDQRSTRTAGDERIWRHIEAKSREELAELVWSLTKRFPELREEFRERIALGEGDAERLAAQTRQELRRVTSEAGWRNNWTGEGHTPDYSRLKHRWERVIELGHPDAVVQLGQELIARGTEQIGQSDDEGETASAFADCVPVIFKAVAESSLPPVTKLLFAIDALLQDDYGVMESDNAEVLLNRQFDPRDWSAVADELARRLKAETKVKDDFHRRYERDRIGDCFIHALTKAGRDDEVLTVCEREARLTGSYERLVKLLVERKRYDEAERWATEGIQKSASRFPGIAANLAKEMGEVARHRRQWKDAAAHAAWEFLERPSRESLPQLTMVSDRAGCRESVERLALQFLKTGVSPISVTTAGEGRPKAAAMEGWPLPVPEHLLPLMTRSDQARIPSRPHYEVLVDMAIADQRPDEVLRWYDKMQDDRKQPMEIWMNRPDGYAERVAAAVARSHPERALEIYRRSLEGNLTRAHMSAYEAVAEYLRKMRPILKSLHREEEWSQTVAEIRLRYRNCPRLVEILDRLDSRPILQSSKERR